MTEAFDFEARFEARLTAHAARASRPFDATAIAEAATAPSGSVAIRSSVHPGSWRVGRFSTLRLAFALLLLAIVAAGTILVAAPPPRTDPTFTETGDPAVDRTGHGAILLQDGRVLIVGGYDVNDPSAHTSAEVYDPATGTFALTGSMVLAGGQDAYLLEDGRAVVEGGASDGWSVEAYDPGTGRFSDAGSLSLGASYFKRPVSSVQLPDGRIVGFGPLAVEGGSDPDPSITGIYRLDVDQRRIDKISEVQGCAGVSHAAALGGSQVLVICDSARSWLELVDVDTGRSTVLTEVLGENAGPLLRLADGRVAFSKGVGAVTLSVLDPTNGQVTPTDVPISPEAKPELTLLADGRVLVTGGHGATVWDSTTGVTTALPAPIAERFDHTATLLEDGRVLIVGGTATPPDAGTSQPAGAELFEPAGH